MQMRVAIPMAAWDKWAMFDDGNAKIGSSLTDRKAPARLRGAGCFVADVALTAPLHLNFARATTASGSLGALDLSAARAVAGVHAVHTGTDVSGLGVLSVNEVIPLSRVPGFPLLAQGQIGGLGQAVAAVLGETPMAARDGAEAVQWDVDETGADGPDRSVVAEKNWRTGDPEAAFDAAAHVVEATITHPRLFPSPMETRGIAVEYADEALTIWSSSQTPHRARTEIAQILRMDAGRLRVIAPDVGGAFGMKGSVYPEEVFAVWAAMTHRRSVRWIASRGEDMLSATQGRGLRSRGRLALSGDGRFTALEAWIEAPVGAWLPNSALIPAWNAARILPGPYDIESVAIETRAVPIAPAPMGIYRGAGRPEAACLMERLVERASTQLKRCAVDLRVQNVYPSGALPTRTVTGNLLDSGDYPTTLLRASDLIGYSALRREQSQARTKGRLFGVGAALYLEPSGEGFETARVTLCTDGSLHVASGSSSQGHGRETAYAQIAGELFDLPPDRVTVIQGDTETCPPGIGAVASRGTAIGGSAVFTAAERVRARSLRGDTLPICEEVRYQNEGQAWGHGLYVVVVEIERETGVPRILKAACLDDAGRLVNPAFVKGQVRGGFAQGLGEALMEQVVYDADGQLLTGSLMDYALPRATDVPSIEIFAQETPTPMNALGVKGVGEAGTIGAPAAILNAVLDALGPLGVTHLDMPLTPCKIWTAIRDAEEKTP
ncbi:xanthine dehydrogenase family protein molybdopterin-binding subunit [Gymnodinialimonas ulvae]|uniref:xanthine dehydrogenase family protein molybdopterin-binding subunit n=1 Tax=Gymnodinialimonas ulvae TaxID=3126504 RepID=UPI0030AA81B9